MEFGAETGSEGDYGIDGIERARPRGEANAGIARG